MADVLQKGVFLDLETVDNGDLDRGRLFSGVTDWDWHSFSEPQQIAGRIRTADVVISNKCVLDRAALESAGNLKLIALAATGTNNVDLAAASELGITVCNIRDYASNSVAQHVITLMLNLLTAQPWYWQSVRHGAWSNSRQFCLNDRPIREFRGLVFGVIGYGALGRATAELAEAMGMKVLIAEHKGRAVRVGRVSFDELIQKSDVLSIHCPLTEETRGLIDREVMQSMQPNVLLINTARGGIINEEHLAEALRERVIGGAGVDTLSAEPPPRDHPLLAPDIPNLIVTPHNAWASRTARQAAVDQLAELIRAFVAGAPLNRVN